VVGGGLAGITTALALADAGVRVTLLEGRPRLGGLAFSFQRGELTVDNGQHVYLRCCTAYRWFLDRIEGAALAPLQDRLDVPVLDVNRNPRGAGSAGCGATRCPCPCIWGAASRRTRISRSPSAPKSDVPRSRSKGSTSPIRRWTPRTSAAG
jgi:choline dehydrogenase-like flavoprotein